MFRMVRPGIRAVLFALAVVLPGGRSLAQTPTASQVIPEPLPMGWLTYPTPGGVFVPYPGMPAFYYPSYGFGYGALPPRSAYGPSVSPLEYPYTGFTPYYPYPGYTAVSPYPRTVSSYSSGPSAYPVIGPVGGRRW